LEEEARGPDDDVVEANHDEGRKAGGERGLDAGEFVRRQRQRLLDENMLAVIFLVATLTGDKDGVSALRAMCGASWPFSCRRSASRSRRWSFQYHGVRLRRWNRLFDDPRSKKLRSFREIRVVTGPTRRRRHSVHIRARNEDLSR
jgi:hypothetical protein